jgi:hypothetical protein
VLTPFVVHVERNGTQTAAAAVADGLATAEGLAGAAAPDGWRRDSTQLVEAFADEDASAKRVRQTISSLQDDVLPPL